MRIALSLLMFLATSARAADWQLQVVDADSLGYYPSLKNAPDGQPAIAHYDGGSQGVRFSRFNGSVWSNSVVAPYPAGWYTSLAFSPTNGRPAIASYDVANFDLLYSTFDGSGWTTTIVDSNGDVGQYCSLAFDTNGYPAISYVAGNPSNDLKFARFNGSVWAITNLDTLRNVAFNVPLAMNPTSGHPAIAYQDYGSNNLFYTAYDGVGWNTTTAQTEGVGYDLSLAFGPDGYPVIGHDGLSSFEIKYTRFNGSSWVSDEVPANSPTYPSMAIRANGDPVFAYRNGTGAGDFWFVERIDGVWTNQLVDPGNNAGTDSSVGFDTNGSPIIAYRHGGINQLWFARRLPVPTSNVEGTNAHLYGANIGWINARGDVTNGLHVTSFYCEGRLWSANCGWIGFGNRPTNGWQYGNTSADDYGVNVERSGALRGRGYGANIGWIRFESQGNPRVDRFTGILSGYAYGANVGWITLSNLYGFARTDNLDPGPDLDGDGLPDAWELSYSGSISNLTAAGDADNDGVPDAAEYLADTDPTDGASLLEITDIARNGNTNLVTWTVEPTRLYQLQQSDAVSNQTAWTDSGLGMLPPGEGTALTGVVTDASATTRYYRAEARIPLLP
jgi:hypothetical protein